MRVLLLAEDFPPRSGGIAEYLSQLCAHLSKRSEVTVIAPGVEEFGVPERDISYRVIRYRISKIALGVDILDRGVMYVLRWFKIFTLFFSVPTTEVILCGDIGASYPEVLWLVAKIRRVPLATLTYAKDVIEKPRSLRKKLLFKLRFRLGVQGANAVFAISDFTRRQLEERKVAAEKIKIIAPGICLDDYDRCEEVQSSEVLHLRQALGLENRKVILSLSRLVERKGFDRVIEAMQGIKEELPEALYLIGGEGPDRQRLEGSVAELSLQDWVKFTGFVKEREKKYYYQMCEFLIMPSRQLPDGDVEGFGIVFLEANMHCKPVVGGKSGGIYDAVEDGVSGLLVDPEDPAAIAEVCLRFLQDKGLQQRLGQQGRERAEKHFSWDKLSQEFLEELKVLIR